MKKRDLEGVFVALGLAELAHDAIELVLAYSVAFFFPFPNVNNSAAFCVHQAQQPPAKRVSATATARAFYCDGGVLHRRCILRREAATSADESCTDGALQHFCFYHNLQTEKA